MLKYILCAVYVCFSVAGLTLIKIGGSQPASEGIMIPIVDMLITKYSILGIMCYGISFCLYICVVNKFDLGIIIPILGGIVNILIILIDIMEKISFFSSDILNITLIFPKLLLFEIIIYYVLLILIICLKKHLIPILIFYILFL